MWRDNIKQYYICYNNNINRGLWEDKLSLVKSLQREVCTGVGCEHGLALTCFPSWLAEFRSCPEGSSNLKSISRKHIVFLEPKTKVWHIFVEKLIVIFFPAILLVFMQMIKILKGCLIQFKDKKSLCLEHIL